MKYLLFLLPIYLLAIEPAKEWAHYLTSVQKSNIIRTYHEANPLNLGYTMAAIIWQESKGGKYLINLQDPSCGPYHNSITSVMSRHNIVDTSFNRNRTCQMLINDWEFAFSESLSELRYWQNVRNGNWTKVWASYNGGWAMSLSYAANIKSKIEFLKTLNLHKRN